MNRNTIKLIAGIIEGTLLKGQSVALRELLWSVDSQLHVIIQQKR